MWSTAGADEGRKGGGDYRKLPTVVCASDISRVQYQYQPNTQNSVRFPTASVSSWSVCVCECVRIYSPRSEKSSGLLMLLLKVHIMPG